MLRDKLECTGEGFHFSVPVTKGEYEIYLKKQEKFKFACIAKRERDGAFCQFFINGGQIDILDYRALFMGKFVYVKRVD